MKNAIIYWLWLATGLIIAKKKKDKIIIEWNSQWVHPDLRCVWEPFEVPVFDKNWNIVNK